MKHRILVRKNVYTYPAWVVMFRGIPLGYAHSGIVAQQAAAIAAQYTGQMNQDNVCPSRLIEQTAYAMSLVDMGQFWIPQQITAKAPRRARTAHAPTH